MSEEKNKIKYDLIITGTNSNNFVKIRSDINRVEFGPESNWDELAETFFKFVAQYGYNIRQSSYEKGYDVGYNDAKEDSK